MMKLKLKKGLRTCIAMASIVVLGMPSIPVHADETVESLQNKTSELQGQVTDLNSELDKICSDLEGISSRIASTTGAMAYTQAELEKAQANEAQQYQDMKKRIKYIYENGDGSFLEVLFSAKDMTDFLNKADFIQTLNEYDRKKLKEFQDIRDSIEETETMLEDEQSTLTTLEAQMTEKRTSLESKIASASTELTQYSSQLERAKAAEAAVKAAMEAQRQQAAAEEAARQEAALRQQQAQENAAPPSSDTSSDPTTPSNPSPEVPSNPGSASSLGVFRITHYCNCAICNGQWAGGPTASGTTPTQGRTIAVDPSVISLGSRVEINGHAYIAEDTGSAIKGKRIDVYVENHEDAMNLGVYYAEVFVN